MKPILLMLALVILGCEHRETLAPVAPAADLSEWRPLFNGRDLSGWKVLGTAAWRVDVKEGSPAMIVGGQEGDPARAGNLITEAEFGDFELELEFMIDEHGKYNSGVYIREPADGKKPHGYQVNIGRGAAGEYCGGVYTDHWIAKGDEADAIRRPLEWNQMTIRAQGAHLVVYLNRQKVVDVVDPAPDPKLLAKGRLALQTYGAEGHAGWVKFRNLRVREFARPPEFK